MIETRFLDSAGANSNLSSDALARPSSLASSAHHAGQTGLFGPFEAGQYPITRSIHVFKPNPRAPQKHPSGRTL